MTIRLLTPDTTEAALPALTDILHATVEAGGSVNFCVPFALAEAEAFWRNAVFPGIDAGEKLVFVAEQNGQIRGTVTLDPASQPNQPHRADVAKLLVHPDARRAGLAQALMTALEDHARHLNRTLLTLDTWSGSAADTLYRALGYQEGGQIPDFFRHPVDGSLQPTTYFWKRLT